MPVVRSFFRQVLLEIPFFIAGLCAGGAAILTMVFDAQMPLFVFLVASLLLFCLHGLHLMFLPSRRWAEGILTLLVAMVLSIVIHAVLFNVFFRDGRTGSRFVLVEATANACTLVYPLALLAIALRAGAARLMKRRTAAPTGAASGK